MKFAPHSCKRFLAVTSAFVLVGYLTIVCADIIAQGLRQVPVTNVSARIKELSNQIYGTMIAEGTQKVAVLPFVTPRTEGDSISYRITLLGWHIADKLANNLFEHKDKFAVVDRTHVEQVTFPRYVVQS